jgi:putative proteasome-type protease
MTYCCGILVREGLVMVADTRTNAGLDNVSTYRKLHVFKTPGERVLVIAAAGNLSGTQSVMHLVNAGLSEEPGETVERLTTMPDMFSAAELIGRAVRRVHEVHCEAAQATSATFEMSFLFGGQIKGAPPQLYMIYTAGNFIECTPDTPFLQIGEHKYGKPVLDRSVSHDTELHEALKAALISMDSTMRSNLSVGLPIDLAVSRTDSLDLEIETRIDASEPYFHDLRDRWSTALRAAHRAIPRPPYGRASG